MTRMSVSIGGKIKTNDYLDKSELKRISSRKSIVPITNNSSIKVKSRSNNRKTLNVTIDDAELNKNISCMSLEANDAIPEISDRDSEPPSPKLKVGGYYYEIQQRNAKL